MSKSPEKRTEPVSEKKNDQIYVGHLSRHTRESDLRKEFEKYGAIKEVLPKNGFAFIVRRIVHEVEL